WEHFLRSASPVGEDGSCFVYREAHVGRTDPRRTIASKCRRSQGRPFAGPPRRRVNSNATIIQLTNAAPVTRAVTPNLTGFESWVRKSWALIAQAAPPQNPPIPPPRGMRSSGI